VIINLLLYVRTVLLRHINGTEIDLDIVFIMALDGGQWSIHIYITVVVGFYFVLLWVIHFHVLEILYLILTEYHRIIL
jgi:hypothetical protein